MFYQHNFYLCSLFLRLTMLFLIFSDFLLTKSFLFYENFIVYNEPFRDFLFNEITGSDLDKLAKDHTDSLNEVRFLVNLDLYKSLHPVHNRINNEAVCAELIGDNYEESPDDFTVGLPYPPQNIGSMSDPQIKAFLKSTIIIQKGSNTQGVVTGEMTPSTRLRVEEGDDLLNRELNREINDIRG